MRLGLKEERILLGLIALTLVIYLPLGLIRPAWAMPRSWKPSRARVFGIWILAWFLVALAIPSGEAEASAGSESAAIEPIGVTRRDSVEADTRGVGPSLEKTESAIAEVIDSAWPVKEIATEGGRTTVVIDLPRVGKSAYLSMIPFVCASLSDLGGAQGQMDEILIANRFVGQGWLFVAPDRCDEIAHTPLAQVESKVAGFTTMPTGLLGDQVEQPSELEPRARSARASKGRPWYEAGTLHRGTVGHWRTATFDNRIATSADFAAVAVETMGQEISSMDQLKPRAVGIEICISEASKSPTPSATPIADLAAVCVMQTALD